MFAKILSGPFWSPTRFRLMNKRTPSSLNLVSIPCTPTWTNNGLSCLQWLMIWRPIHNRLTASSMPSSSPLCNLCSTRRSKWRRPFKNNWNDWRPIGALPPNGNSTKPRLWSVTIASNLGTILAIALSHRVSCPPRIRSRTAVFGSLLAGPCWNLVGPPHPRRSHRRSKVASAAHPYRRCPRRSSCDVASRSVASYARSTCLQLRDAPFLLFTRLFIHALYFSRFPPPRLSEGGVKRVRRYGWAG